MSRTIQVTPKSINKLESYRDTGSGKLLFTTVKGLKMALLLKGDHLMAAQVLSSSDDRMGAVYLGRVQKFAANINAYFVEIAPGEICFLPAKELLPGQVLKGAAELPVQIIRASQKTKLPTVTARISLSNQYAAISSGKKRTGYSAKLTPGEKEKLKEWLLSADITDSYGASGYDLVIRTAAGKCPKEHFLDAVRNLIYDFDQLLQTAAHRNAPCCIREAQDPCLSILHQIAHPQEYQEIVTDDTEIYHMLQSTLETETEKTMLRLYEDTDFSLSKLYGLESKLENALERIVWLKSGAYLVIEPTEALTVIDVNSGKFEASRHKGTSETIWTINKEAAEEIAIQLRLRNLSGIILVDFINMPQKEQESDLLQYMTSLVKSDFVLTRIVDITSLGLMEITRKKTSPTLAEQVKKSRYEKTETSIIEG